MRRRRKSPPNGVAVVGDEVISKKEFNHWLNARGQGPGAADRRHDADVGAGPARLRESASRRKKKTPLPKGTPKPKDADLKKQCKQEFDVLKSSLSCSS